MERIAEEARTEPEVLREAPHHTPNSRLDEGRAARELKLRWSPPGAADRAGAHEPIART
jgi:glycine dehydrogenase subunit 2